MLSFEPIGNPADADCLIGHSFGTSIHEHSVNGQLASLMLRYADGRPMIADRTLVDAMPGDTSQMAHTVEGQRTNHKAQGVGTWGTLSEAKDYMNAHGLIRPMQIGQAYHIPRVVRQGEKLGMTSIVPYDLPTDFDKESEQIWTRSPYLWVPFNALGSVLLKRRGQL